VILRVFISIIILIFSFQSLTKADDIKDFQIEGISIADTLLKYATNQQIDIAETNSSIMRDKNGNDRFIIIFLNTMNLNEYEDLQITYKSNDKNFIIHAIDGGINFPNNFEHCKNKQTKIVSDLKNMFKNVPLRSFQGKHNADDSGGSIHNSNIFTLSNGTIHIWCTLWSDKVNYNDGLNVTLRSKEYNDFLLNENDY